MPPLLFLVGPTASGKSAVAVELALALDGEVIGLDSMQIYRGLPVLSAAPGADEQRGIPHHLIGELELGATLDASRFREAALARVAEVEGRGHIPVLVGGSGLYYSAIVHGLSALPPADAKLRDELLAQARLQAAGWMHTELARLDPVSANRLHPNDEHRLLRALEVCRLTGRPYSEQVGRKQPLPSGQFMTFGLSVPRERLHERIDARAARMFESGAVAEVAAALGIDVQTASLDPEDPGQQGLARLATARQMLGVSQIFGYLTGKYDLAEAQRLLARDTRRYARRQMTWFRSCEEIHWIEVMTVTSPARAAGEILRLWWDSSSAGA